jgi:hypothetical protein
MLHTLNTVGIMTHFAKLELLLSLSSLLLLLLLLLPPPPPLLLLLILTAIEFSLGGSSPSTTMNNLKNTGQNIKRKEKEFMEKVNFTKIQVCWE